jgi:protein-S-isoprenylcysteine O-methyltransferase Ste14
VSHSELFRAGLAALFTGFAGLWLINLRSAGVKRGTFYGGEEGLLIAVPVRLALAASITGVVACIISPASMAWSSVALPSWARWLGLAMGVPALMLLAWILRTLGRNFSISLAIHQGHTLVTEGPYRWVRHPMYTAFILLCISFSLLSANWFIGGTGLLAYSVVAAIRTPREERMMIQQFGDAYRSYMKRSGRFLPRLAALRNGGIERH